MRAFHFCVLLFLLVVVSSASVVQARPAEQLRGSEALEALFAPVKQSGSLKRSKHACDTCNAIVAKLTAIASNATQTAAAEADLTAACDLIIDLDPTLKPLQGLCSVLPSFLFNLALFGVHSGANGSSILCADVLELCVQPCCSSDHTPEQVHIAFATPTTVGAGAALRVGWVTLRAPGNGTSSAVQWRRAATDDAWTTTNATLSTYTLGGWEGVLHFAVLDGLVNDTEYEYTVGAAGYPWSPVFTFRTLPTNIGTAERPLRYIGVTDMSFRSAATATRARIEGLITSGAVDFVMHPGDVGYADGDQSWWDIWFREMQPSMSRVPYMTGLGNHEVIWWNATAYKHRYLMPPAGGNSPSDALWYAIHVGPVTLVVLDVEAQNDTPFLGDDQLAWLQATLSEAAAAGRATIVNLHRPLYCSSYPIKDCTQNCYYLRSRLEETLRRYRVSVVMNGHVHNYERTWPVYNGTVTQTSYDNSSAPVYFVNGGAGNQEGQASFYTNNNTWSAARTMERAFMRFDAWRDVEGGGAAGTPSFGAVYINATLIRSSDGSVLDTILVTRRFP